MSSFVTVAPLTTFFRCLSLHVKVEPSGETGLDVAGYVQCEPIRSIIIRRLGHRDGAVSPAVAARVSEVVRILLNH